MIEKKGLNPVDQIYLENLFETSNKFSNDISNLRQKYKGIKFDNKFENIVNIDANKDYKYFFYDIDIILSILGSFERFLISLGG